MALAIALLAGCGGTSTPANAAVTVNGHDVPKSLYDTLDRSSQSKLDRTGARIDPNSAQGKDQIRRLQRSALETVVRDSLIEQMAAQRHVSVGPDEVDQSVQQVKDVLGPASFQQRLQGEALSLAEFKNLLRYNLLEQKMRQADPNFDAALQDATRKAKVMAYVGPCSEQHDYPRCTGA